MINSGKDIDSTTFAYPDPDCHAMYSRFKTNHAAIHVADNPANLPATCPLVLKYLFSSPIPTSQPIPPSVLCGIHLPSDMWSGHGGRCTPTWRTSSRPPEAGDRRRMVGCEPVAACTGRSPWLVWFWFHLDAFISSRIPPPPPTHPFTHPTSHSPVMVRRGREVFNEKPSFFILSVSNNEAYARPADVQL